MAILKVNQLTKTYRFGDKDIHALNNVSFEINEGEFVVILGSSGAGKTTLLNLIGAMDVASSGEIIVDGNDIVRYNDTQRTKFRRDEIGFVFQFYNLIQNLTVIENIEMATQITENTLNIDEVLKAVQLFDRKEHFPSQLSGGEQQRVAIARAIAKNPKLLLCDEPTGALDYRTGKKVLQLLQQISQENRKTIIMITHNIALANIGDRVIKMQDGKIISNIINNNPLPISEVEW